MSPPQDSGQGLAGQLPCGTAAPTGRQAVGWRLGTYLGFELFQKTVWRSAAARLQQRPKRGAQRNSIARGLARPSEDAGLLGVWAHAGFLGGALRAALTDLAPVLRDSAFWARAAPTPRPAPAPPSQRLPRGLGVGEVEEGSEGLGSRACASAGTDCLRAARSLALGACVVWWVRVPWRRREPTPPAALRTRGGGTWLCSSRAHLAGCKVKSRTFPEPCAPGSGAAFPHLASPPPLPGLCARLPLPTHAAVCFCWICQCCLCSRACVIAWMPGIKHDPV